MARPYPKFTPEQVIAALVKCRGLTFQAARELGCSYDTVERMINKHPEVRRAREQQRGEFVDTAEDKLRDAVDAGESWAVTFTLKCLGKKRGYVERTEQTGADGGPIQHQVNWDDMTRGPAQPPADPIEDRIAGADDGS